MEVDPQLVVPDTSLSLRQGAIAPWKGAMERGEGWTFRIIDALAKACDVDLDVPWAKLGAKKQKQILYGLGDRKIKVEWGSKSGESHGSWGMRFEGVIHQLMRRFQQTNSQPMREHYARFLSEQPCTACGGHRLRVESLHVRVAGKAIHELSALTVSEAQEHVRGLTLTGNAAAIA